MLVRCGVLLPQLDPVTQDPVTHVEWSQMDGFASCVLPAHAPVGVNMGGPRLRSETMKCPVDAGDDGRRADE